MNHIYRVVFNKETGTYQAISEIAKQSHKSHSSKGGKLLKTLLIPLALTIGVLSALSAHAAPTAVKWSQGLPTSPKQATLPISTNLPKTLRLIGVV